MHDYQKPPKLHHPFSNLTILVNGIDFPPEVSQTGGPDIGLCEAKNGPYLSLLSTITMLNSHTTIY